MQWKKAEQGQVRTDGLGGRRRRGRARTETYLSVCQQEYHLVAVSHPFHGHEASLYLSLAPHFNDMHSRLLRSIPSGEWQFNHPGPHLSLAIDLLIRYQNVLKRYNVLALALWIMSGFNSLIDVLQGVGSDMRLHGTSC